MGLELKRAMFSKNLKQTMACSFTFYAQRTFVALQFVDLMTQKSLNSVKE